MMNVAAIISLRNLSITVEYGFASTFYYSMAALCFFIPSALVCAELATGFPKAGGLYAWVGEAFGKEVGFFAVWCSWMLSVSWYPTVLTFTAGALAYVFNPELINNKLYMVTTMLTVFWAATLINFRGMKISGSVSAIGAALGTLIPGALIIGLGFFWYVQGNPIQIEMNFSTLIPEFNLSDMVFFAGVILSFAGMELSCFHVQETKDPQRDFPRAILYSTLIILAISILGSLSIAFVVSPEELSLFAGILQAFQFFFGAFDLGWGVPGLALLAVLGSLAGINTWILGPAKGILTCAKDGFLPPFLQKVNDKQMPVGTLVFQGAAASILTLVFFLMPDVNSAFWIVTALTTLFAMLMYLLIFAAGIKLRYLHPNTPRPYHIPGKYHLGMWLVAGTGIVMAVFAITICFVPPIQLNLDNPALYCTYLLVGLIILSMPPLLFLKLKKPGWVHLYAG